MRIGVDMGHTLVGKGTGAVGVASETEKNRLAGKRLIELLKANGHTVINCTVDKSQNDLYDRCKLANAQPLDLFVSLHLNFCEGGYGVETYCYSVNSKSYSYAKAIQNELVKSIQWRDRGVKTASYYVLKHTSAPAVLVELGFCDSAEDMRKWDTEKIAQALYKGITGTAANNVKEEVKEEVKEDKKETVTSPTQTNSVYELAKSYNASKCKELQEKLIKCGYDCGKYGADGIYGKATHEALGKFQADNKLGVDYLAGKATFAKLDELIANKSNNLWVKRLQEECNKQGFSNQKVDGIAGPNTLKACPVLRKGSMGGITKLLQEALKVNVDGIFGTETYNAVINYQKRYNLTADGIVGKDTWTKLLNL